MSAPTSRRETRPEPEKTRSEIRSVRLTTIVPPRPGLRDLDIDPDHLANLAGIIDDCPPIVVQRGSLRLIDGLHRVEAARRLGRTHVAAEIIDVPDELLTAERIRRNSRHGLPLSRQARRRAAQLLLREHPDWSDRRIGRHAGLSHTTVGRVRAQCPGGAPRHLDTARRIGRDGRAYLPHPGAAREHALRLLTEDPSRSDRSIARETGLSPTTIGSLRKRRHPRSRTWGRIKDLMMRLLDWLQGR